MKKSLVFLLTAALLLAAGCTPASTPAEPKPDSSVTEPEEETAAAEKEPDAEVPSATEEAHAAPEQEAQTLQTLEQFRGGDFDTLYTNVTETVAAQAPKDQLKISWDSLLSMLGAYEGVVSQESYSQQGMTQVVITEKYSLQNLQATFVYDADGKVAGLSFTFPEERTPYVPESADTYEEVSIQVGAESQKMDGVLTLPKNVEHPPVVVMVQGSGQSDLNESVGNGNRPFADIAHGLAQQGIATIRYNKRFYQYPPSSVEGLTIEAEVTDDVRSAIQLAAADSRVDSDRVYVLGHSLGGMLAPKIAQDNPEVKGIICMAGTLRQLQDVMLEQTKAILDANANLSPEKKAESLSQLEEEYKKFDDLFTENPPDAILGQPGTYWASLNSIDSKEIVKSLTIPILILQGENDFQVYASVDYPLWEETLKGKDTVTYHLYPGLSHLFMPASSAKYDPALYSSPGHVDEQVIRDIGDWINSL